MSNKLLKLNKTLIELLILTLKLASPFPYMRTSSSELLWPQILETTLTLPSFCIQYSIFHSMPPVGLTLKIYLESHYLSPSPLPFWLKPPSWLTWKIALASEWMFTLSHLFPTVCFPQEESSVSLKAKGNVFTINYKATCGLNPCLPLRASLLPPSPLFPLLQSLRFLAFLKPTGMLLPHSLCICFSNCLEWSSSRYSRGSSRSPSGSAQMSS